MVSSSSSSYDARNTHTDIWAELVINYFKLNSFKYLKRKKKTRRGGRVTAAAATAAVNAKLMLRRIELLHFKTLVSPLVIVSLIIRLVLLKIEFIFKGRL